MADFPVLSQMRSDLFARRGNPYPERDKNMEAIIAGRDPDTAQGGIMRGFSSLRALGTHN